MEEMHHTHKEVPFGWLAMLTDFIQHVRARGRKAATGGRRYLTAAWVGRTPTGWSA